MSLNADPIFPSFLDHTEPKEMDAQRRLALREIRGDVLEIGIGRGEQLPFQDERFDSVVLVDVLCSVEDVHATLAEAFRVLKPGGRLHILEHGLAEDARIRRWQHRLNGLNRRTACGCELTRDPEKRLRDSSFQIDELVRVPPFAGTGALYAHIRGTATRCA
jgi:ubiquinone/menaquinone biosynthesis C-methylase UbiE